MKGDSEGKGRWMGGERKVGISEGIEGRIEWSGVEGRGVGVEWNGVEWSGGGSWGSRDKELFLPVFSSFFCWICLPFATSVSTGGLSTGQRIVRYLDELYEVVGRT